MAADTLSTFIYILTQVLFFAILIRALMSWVMPNDSSGISRVLQDVTEPILAPVRRVLPPVGGIDFSPLLAMVLLYAGGSILSNLVAGAA